MSFYIIEDDDGNVLDSYGEFNNSVINAMLYDEPSEPEGDVKEYGGHVVKLVEAPAKVVVSEEEAKMLEQAKDDYCAASVISAYSTEHIGAMGQDRLMRAYVIGWTVEKPKRWNVKVPHTKDVWYYKSWNGSLQAIGQSNKELVGKFTESEIEHYGLQDCEKEEVTDDE